MLLLLLHLKEFHQTTEYYNAWKSSEELDRSWLNLSLNLFNFYNVSTSQISSVNLLSYINNCYLILCWESCEFFEKWKGMSPVKWSGFKLLFSCKLNEKDDEGSAIRPITFSTGRVNGPEPVWIPKGEQFVG